METRRDVFQGIADPTRRHIIHLIARKSMNLNAIADKFDISRPAVSNHIKILNECGLVAIEQVGRERYCRIQPENLRKVSDWIDPFRELWEEKLNSFEKYLETLQTKSRKNEKSKRKKRRPKRRSKSNPHSKKNI
ncbi:MAG TPA: metalloregulator ArsR/SmtB family transcription factor [Chryseosolibacter sp.]|nr:metalloregulator ArsR/SmtB family transcription factor [Chryseosolibacter sp.]